MRQLHRKVLGEYHAWVPIVGKARARKLIKRLLYTTNFFLYYV